jgi:hypothetical protein
VPLKISSHEWQDGQEVAVCAGSDAVASGRQVSTHANEHVVQSVIGEATQRATRRVVGLDNPGLGRGGRVVAPVGARVIRNPLVASATQNATGAGRVLVALRAGRCGVHTAMLGRRSDIARSSAQVSRRIGLSRTVRR